jgi:hypothetical protein
MRKRSLLAGMLAGAIAAPIALSGGEQVSGLRHATGWLNSPPLTEADLRGKVVLVDFWTSQTPNSTPLRDGISEPAIDGDDAGAAAPSNGDCERKVCLGGTAVEATCGSWSTLPS